MSYPVLYSFRRCPYAIRARLALAKCGVDYQLREVSLKNKPVELLAISEKATVPVLSLENRLIDESIDIMAWASASAEELATLNEFSRSECRTGRGGWQSSNVHHYLIERNDHYFKYWLDRYKYADRYLEQTQHYYFEHACGYLSELERALDVDEDSQCVSIAGIESLIDSAIFPFVRQFAFVDKSVFDTLDFPKLQTWLQQWLDSEVFAKVMQKTPFWHLSRETVLVENNLLTSTQRANKMHKEQPIEETSVLKVEHDELNHVFLIAMPDGDNATLKYRLDQNSVGESSQVDFHSTFVPKQHRAKGLAEELVDTGLEWAKVSGLKIEASCWYVDKRIKAA